MSAPAGGQYDFKRDVLDRKPDLVTIEFVNDAYLQGDALNEQYAKIRDALRAIPAEIILITPHYVRQDWMNVSTVKVDEDPRPYVRGLREFAEANGIAVATPPGCGRIVAQRHPVSHHSGQRHQPSRRARHDPVRRRPDGRVPGKVTLNQ